MHGVLCLLKGVSAFPHLQVQIKTHAHTRPFSGIFPDRQSLPRAQQSYDRGYH